MHGTAGQRASPANTNTTVLIRDQRRLSNTVTQQSVPLWRKQGSIRPLTLLILKSSRQLRLDFNLAHMSCLTCLNCVCVWLCVCLSECLHVVEVVEWCKSRWFWTFPACSSAPACPRGRPQCSWESHGSISDGILWACAAAWVTLRTATPD